MVVTDDVARRGQRRATRSEMMVLGIIALAALAGQGSSTAASVPEPAPPQADISGVQDAPKSEETAKPAAKRKPKRFHGCRIYASPAYRKMVRRWQTIPPIPKPRWRAGFRDLTMYSVNLGERIRLFPFSPDGGLDPAALVEIARLLRDKDTGAIHDVAPRLVKLVYKLAAKFDVRQIAVISGYRQPEGEEGGGHHADGTAIDISFSGVRLPVLAQAARRLGHVGVGLYPTSGFVHLDVRESRSYFWVDRSGPGQPGCLRSLGSEAAFSADAKWRPENDDPAPKKNRKGEIVDDAPHE
jgi:uncharacterized protein YcbK (DUF882 family)